MKSLLLDRITVAPRKAFDKGSPHINGPAEFGVSPGKECIFTFPVRGEKPVTFRIEGELPPGILFDPVSGRFSGRPEREGDFPVRVIAFNVHGEDVKDFTLRVHPDKIGLAPLLGWTSWNAFRTDFDQEKILRTARALIKTGLAARGYNYINIDSGWQGCTRDKETKALDTNYRFPDMASMVREIHELGLHAGIYSTPMVIAWGSTHYEIFRGSCGYPVDVYGSLQTPEWLFFGGLGKTPFEKEDAARWAEWGFDYLKYDWSKCDIAHSRSMSEALRATDRDFVYSLTTICPPEWAEEYRAIAHMYRNNPDTEPCWRSVRSSILSADSWLKHCGPGGWFDMDMLALGPVHEYFGDAVLTNTEAVTAFSAWALLGSPIQISCDLERIDDFTLDVLSNEELLAVNQDTSSVAELIKSVAGAGGYEFRIYRKTLSDGSMVYGFFNLGEEPCYETFDLGREYRIRDLWACRDLGKTDTLKMSIPAHGVRMLQVC